MKKSNKEFSMADEFSVEELENRLELKAAPWIGPCENPTHCHPEKN